MDALFPWRAKMRIIIKEYKEIEEVKPEIVEEFKRKLEEVYEPTEEEIEKEKWEDFITR